MSELDGLEDQRTLSTPEANFRDIVKAHLLKMLQFQNEYWRKHCTIRYIKFGEENTKLFLALATERYKKNSIASLKLPDGSIATDHNAKEAILLNTYKERLGVSSTPTMKFDLASIIKQVDNLDSLTTPFTHQEIEDVVKSMPTDRTPGPDGFNGTFLKSCWHIIKEDFYKLCDDFYEGKLDLTSVNSGFITLIPKIGSPETANDFTPITLLNCCMKIITKILANRLQKLILSIVHRNQYGFLRTRMIQDCLAWAFEYIYQCQSSKRPIIILKLDFVKAFDTIEHSSMLEIMKHMGLGERWLGWIKMFFSSGTSSVLLNGVPDRQF